MNTPPGMPNLYTVQEVADTLRVHARTVYTLIRRQELGAIRIGTQWRVPESALFAFIEKGGWAAPRRQRRGEARQLPLPLDDLPEENPDDRH